MEKYYNILRGNLLFAGYDDNQLNKALNEFRCRVSHYKKNDVIFVGCKRLERFGIVLCGSVKVYNEDIDGNRVIMASVSAGTSFGESICFLKIEDSGIYIEAGEECSVLWLNPFGINEEIKNRFISLIAARTLQMNMRIQILSKLTIREKLLTFFSEMCHTKGARGFDIPMNREDLSLFLGTNRSALCRELSKMKDEGIIDYHGSHFEIL